jgi:hypothetical protein
VGGNWCGRHPVASPTATAKSCGAARFLAAPDDARRRTHAARGNKPSTKIRPRTALTSCLSSQGTGRDLASAYLVMYIVALPGLEGNGTWPGALCPRYGS